MSAAPLVTVLTPTWNRAHTLPRLKTSLDAQTNKDFEWLVVDDGSEDGTPELLASWEGKTAFPFRHIRTANGGKHRALNRGVPEARGEAVFIVDSDDELPADSIETVAGAWPRLRDDPGLAGLVGYKAEGRRPTHEFPEGVERASSLDLAWRLGCPGDKAEIFRTEALRLHPFPEFEGERFLTEAVVWNRIAAEHELLLLRSVLYHCEYRADGLSARSAALRSANPRGTDLYYRELLRYDIPSGARLRALVNLLRFRLLRAPGARRASSEGGGRR